MFDVVQINNIGIIIRNNPCILCDDIWSTFL